MNQPGRPLLLTADMELLDDVLGAAGAVGAAVDVAVEPATCGPQWTDTPLVLVGADLAVAAVAAGLRPRSGVLLVGRGIGDGELRELADRVGADRMIRLPADEAILVDQLADVSEPTARARVLAVVGARGGAGTSVLAAGLALTAAARGPAWLIDLDPFGGGADVGVGVELSAGARWADLEVTTGRLSSAALRRAVPEVLGVAVVATGPGSGDDPAPDAVRAVLGAAQRGGGTVVVDLARHPGPSRDAAVRAADELFVVVPAEVRAVLAGRQVVTSLGRAGPMPRAIVRTVPSGLPVREVVRALDLPGVGVLADEPLVRTALLTGDAGDLLRNPGLAALCGQLLDGTATLRSAA